MWCGVCVFCCVLCCVCSVCVWVVVVVCVSPSLRPPVGSEIRAEIQPTFSIALTFGSSQSAVLGTSGSPFELDLFALQKKHFILDLSEHAPLGLSLSIPHCPTEELRALNNLSHWRKLRCRLVVPELNVSISWNVSFSWPCVAVKVKRRFKRVDVDILQTSRSHADAPKQEKQASQHLMFVIALPMRSNVCVTASRVALAPRSARPHKNTPKNPTDSRPAQRTMNLAA